MFGKNCILNICHVNLASGFGGGEQQTLQLIKHQILLGYYNVTVVARSGSKFYDEISKLDCELIGITQPFLGHIAVSNLSIDVIHAHEGRAIYWALIENKIRHKPYIITRRIANKFKDKFFSNYAYTNSNAIVSISNFVANLTRSKFPDSRVSLIPDSYVSYTVNNELKKILEVELSGKKVVLMAANMFKFKGFDVAVNAAKNIQNTHPNIHFVLLGDGPEFENVQLQAADLKNVTLAGRTNDMGTWFSVGDLLINPSYTEGLSSVLLEGMKAGLPLIGSNVGGIPDIIEDGKTGFLFTPGDHRELSDLIVKVLEDKSLLEALCSYQQEKLASFSIDSISNRYEKLYLEVTNSRGTRYVNSR